MGRVICSIDRNFSPARSISIYPLGILAEASCSRPVLSALALHLQIEIRRKLRPRRINFALGRRALVRAATATEGTLAVCSAFKCPVYGPKCDLQVKRAGGGGLPCRNSAGVVGIYGFCETEIENYVLFSRRNPPAGKRKGFQELK